MHLPWTLQLLLCSWFAVAAAASGQAPAPAHEGSRPEFVAAFDAGAPLLVAATGAAAFPLRGELTRGHHGLVGDAFVVSVQLGVAGAKVGAGVSRFGDGAAFHLSAVAVQTWDNAWLAREDATHVGIEVAVRAMAARFAVGPLYSVSDPSGEWSAIATVGLGF
jgi:hypothetical protein